MAARKKAAAKKTSASLKEYNRKRDFTKTKEPSGKLVKSAKGKLQFVIQKHAASHLHFDLRLELDGAMKSWAVPKGPSADPTVKRLAMEVENHPISYNSFEGTIPEGEYGGGTVMLWDTGTYSADAATGSSKAAQEDAIREGYERGDLKVTFDGKRIRGSYAIVRTRGFGRSSSKPSWLLIKHKADKFARPEAELNLVEKYVTSVTTGRKMEEIAAGKKATARKRA